jgi:hypothetical protein
VYRMVPAEATYSWNSVTSNRTASPTKDFFRLYDLVFGLWIASRIISLSVRDLLRGATRERERESESFERAKAIPSVIGSMSANDRPQVRERRGTVGEPSVSISVFVYWIVPVMLIAALTRFVVDTGPAFRPLPSKPMSLSFDDVKSTTPTPQPSAANIPISTDKAPRKSPSEMPSLLTDKPTSYQEVCCWKRQCTLPD